MPSSRLVVAALFVLAAALAPGCSKSEKKNVAAQVPQAVKVTIALDDKVLTDSPALTAAPMPLAAVAGGAPPLERWIAVEAVDQTGTVSTLLSPAKNYPGAVPALSADAKGVQFGLLRGGALEQAVGNIAKITIKTQSDAGKPPDNVDHGGAGGSGGGDSGGGGDHGGGANAADKGVRAVPTADLKIEVETAQGVTTFTGDKMAGLPELKAPSGDTETPGWSLVEVLAAAGLKDVKVVVLTDEANATLKIEGDDWDPAKAILYLKLNKSGQIRFRVFRKTGDLWEVTGELRGIKSIKVL